MHCHKPTQIVKTPNERQQWADPLFCANEYLVPNVKVSEPLGTSALNCIRFQMELELKTSINYDKVTMSNQLTVMVYESQLRQSVDEQFFDYTALIISSENVGDQKSISPNTGNENCNNFNRKKKQSTLFKSTRKTKLQKTKLKSTKRFRNAKIWNEIAVNTKANPNLYLEQKRN